MNAEWICATCGQSHDDLPLSFAADYPDNYANMSAEDRDNRAVVSSDQCIIDDEEFYIRGLLEIPIQGAADSFLWGVWALVRSEDFDEIQESWTEQGRELKRGPYKGRLANSLSVYSAETVNLKLTLIIQPIGQRPLFQIDQPDHPLAVQQRDGLSRESVQGLVEKLLHPTSRSVS